MVRERWQIVSRVQYIHEAMFSLNLAFAIVALSFGLEDRFAFLSPIIGYFQSWEISIHRALRMRQTDFIEGHISFFLPGIILALCVWGLVRLFSDSGWGKEILHSVSGLVALATPPAWWFCVTYRSVPDHASSLLRAAQLYEVVIILALAVLYLQGWRHVPVWGKILILLLHYGFWLWQFGPYHIFTFFYSWQILPVVGLCASLAWVFYAESLEDGSMRRKMS